MIQSRKNILLGLARANPEEKPPFPSLRRERGFFSLSSHLVQFYILSISEKIEPIPKKRCCFLVVSLPNLPITVTKKISGHAITPLAAESTTSPKPRSHHTAVQHESPVLTHPPNSV
jgi:hypothetical protein